MIAAWATALLLAGRFAWPGALELDGRALAELPAPDRPAAAARLVARHGFAAARPYLLPLLTDDDPTVRVPVARLLVRGGEQSAVEAAVRWVIGPTSTPADRALGLDVLSWTPALTASGRHAIELAIRDPNAGIRLRALEALARHDPLPSLAPILGALDDDIRDVRAAALARITEAALAHPAESARAAPPLLERLDDPDRGLRAAALRALGLLGDPRTIPALVRIASEESVDLRTAAVDALGRPAMAAALPTLIAFARARPADDVARHAALALGEIATPPAISALVAGLRGPDVPDEIPLALHRALVRAGSATIALAALADETVHGTPASAARAAALLGQSGDRRATAPLAAAVDRQEEAPALTVVAIDALGGLRDPAAVASLARATLSPDADVRIRALDALRAIGDPRAVALLDRALADPDAQVRAAGAALAAVVVEWPATPGEALPIDRSAVALRLATALGDGSAAVRMNAARAANHLAAWASLPAASQSSWFSTALAAAARVDDGARDDAELDILGDLWEAMTTGSGGSASALDAAFLAAGPRAQAALARGLAGAHRERLALEGPVVDRLLAMAATGGRGALAAAEALATATLSDGAAARIARIVADAEPTLAARLTPAIARAPGGGEWLAALIAAPTLALEVRAAAAWSARGLGDARPALGRAAGLAGPLGDNARAALSVGAQRAGAWAAVRAVDDAGMPLAGRWLTFEAGGLQVAARTDATGRAGVDGLPAGAAIAVAALGLSRPAGSIGPIAP